MSNLKALPLRGCTGAPWRVATWIAPACIHNSNYMDVCLAQVVSILYAHSSLSLRSQCPSQCLLVAASPERVAQWDYMPTTQLAGLQTS